MKNVVQKILILFIVAVSSVLYLFTLKGAQGNFKLPENTSVSSPFESSHERSSFAETVLLVKSHTFVFPRAFADFGSPDVGYTKGKFYSLFPPGISVTIIPLYLLGQMVGYSQLFAFSTISILALLSLLLLYKMARNIFGLSISISLFTALMFGFATSAWAYSNTIYQHIPTVFLLLTAIYCGWRAKNAKRIDLVWGGIAWAAVGLSIFFDYPNIILMIPVGIYLLISLFEIKDENDKWRVRLSLGILLGSITFFFGIILYLLFAHTLFGSWFQTTNTIHRYNSSDPTSLVTSQNTNINGVFDYNRLPSGMSLLLTAPEKGIFIFSPIFILIFVAIFSLKKVKQNEKILLIVLPVLNLLMYASFSDPWGGWAFGPRYLIPSMPFLALIIGIWLNGNKNQIFKKTLAIIFFAISSAVAVAGALTTNLLPPKVEAIGLNIKYGLPVTFAALNSNKSTSFVFNTFLHNNISLLQYFLVLYILANILAFISLFIVPIFNYEN